MSQVSCLLLCLLLAGCGENEVLSGPDAASLISEGWKEYVAGNYEDSIDIFQKVLTEEPGDSESEAYNGIGWAKARLGLENLQEPIDSFKKAIEKDPRNADAYAGLAGVYLADGDYERAIASAKSVLLIAPEYVSLHDNIKAYDIHILLAECYYVMGDYVQAKAQIDLLSGSGKALDPSSPAYPADLLSLIEGLAEKSRLANIGKMGSIKT